MHRYYFVAKKDVIGGCTLLWPGGQGKVDKNPLQSHRYPSRIFKGPTAVITRIREELPWARRGFRAKAYFS